jgi:hypothetical protein
MGYFLPPLAVRTRSIATLTKRLTFFVQNSSSRTLTASSLESSIFSMQSDVEMTRSSHARRFPLIKNEAETCEHGLEQLKAGACIHLRTMLAAATLEAAAAAAAAVAVPRMRPACGRDCECGRGRRKIWAGPSVWAAWPASPSSAHRVRLAASFLGFPGPSLSTHLFLLFRFARFRMISCEPLPPFAGSSLRHRQ